MNTGLIKNTKTLRYPDFSIGAKKNSRVVTRNYANLTITMDANKLSLLTWLIFHCGMDNRIKYNTQLLKRYIATIKAVETHFDRISFLAMALQTVRQNLKSLIEDGYIIAWCDELVLNPLLSYQSDYVTVKGYQALTQLPMDQIAGEYVRMVNEKVYGKAYKHKTEAKV